MRFSEMAVVLTTTDGAIAYALDGFLQSIGVQHGLDIKTQTTSGADCGTLVEYRMRANVDEIHPGFKAHMIAAYGAEFPEC